jgi:hypothetical protein
MKKYITNAAKMLLAIGMIVPFVTMAQDQPKQDKKAEEEKFTYGAPAYWRPYSQNGIGVFETTKENANKAYDGKKIRFGAGFTMQYQNLKHENPTAINNGATGANHLYPVKPGFMTAQANLFIDAQLGDGITMNVTNYMSSRHHNEFWVKGGYLQLDKMPFKSQFFDGLMKFTTIKVGHFEINYGDAHFRRPDGGQTIQSPFMEGNIMDAFATEIGGEVILQKNGFFGLLGVTSGMIKGHIDSTMESKDGSGNVIDANVKRNPSLYLKGGIDKQLTEQVRFRVSGSLYTNSSNAGSGVTLYSGDRTGSNYQNIMEKGVVGALPASTTMYASGRFNPGFSKKITAIMLNSFVKAYGFEFFGTYEQAKGRSKSEVKERKANQIAVEGLYRFGANENLYVGARYNTVKSEMLFGTAIQEIKINRTAFAAGWFVTKNMLLKAEIVNQKYLDFPTSDYRSSGKFNGFVIEAAVGL